MTANRSSNIVWALSTYPLDPLDGDAVLVGIYSTSEKGLKAAQKIAEYQGFKAELTRDPGELEEYSWSSHVIGMELYQIVVDNNWWEDVND